ncbi:DNA translocase FtsK [Macrococcus armenti]|uniref:FtsK/SpoIIIE family DNA translocase n=1 Tax=Macrococcus armenti TaxID=2875764 RepID=UPI001CCBB465|nr:DNA translocase FtsK [Macrococcus armenti]UBH23310.1 DNA translocase FtsK [Macrococcus armenti]
MAIKKKTRKKRRPAKKNNTTPYRYLFALIIISAMVIGMLQFGILGTGIDSLFAYLTGSARFYVYILIILITMYYAVNNKMIPLNRRVNGWLFMLFAFPSFLQVIQHIINGKTIKPIFNTIYELQSRTGIHFFGGGIIGYIYDVLFSTLLSTVGSLMLSIVMVVMSILLILGKSIRLAAQQLLHFIINRVKDIQKMITNYYNHKRSQKETKIENHEQPADVTHLEEVTEVEEIPIYDGNTSVIKDDLPIEKVEQNAYQQTIEEVDQIHEQPISEDENINYKLPPIHLLNAATEKAKNNMQMVKKRGQLLETTLKNFGVNAKVSQIKIGPAVTQYEIQPAMGVKVSRIVNLHNDIALALAAKDIRIEAPIPGKSAVGIEVPNQTISMVTLREVIEASPVTDNKLKVVLGRDISGDAITAELDKMPHLLVAGATGSGKSVCINGIITSILMHAKPHEVKLMMIDPKMVELNVYNGIPHLLTPVVTNPQKAAQALQKIVGEMERRYDLFSHTGTRNIKGYNDYLERQNKELNEKNAKLPYIVVIVDELADLMMVASKDVEAAIMRLAQMARAAGIHLIIATQRPSVDVITGLIKANIPSRIAFSVSSAVDSRTILDSQGAEKLLGKGDMLYLPYGQSKPTRIQGAFLSDAEVEAVVNYVTSQQSANYIEEMKPDAVEESESHSEDELYADVYAFVIEKQKASASLLQRQFRIGYNRAARLIDELEANGVIGPATGSKPRSVLIEANEE